MNFSSLIPALLIGIASQEIGTEPATPSRNTAVVASAELVAKIRLTYAKLPAIRSHVRSMVNTAHEGADTGTLSLSEAKINAERDTGRLSMRFGELPLELRVTGDMRELRVQTPLLPKRSLTLSTTGAPTTKPVIDLLRALSSDGTLPAPWPFFEASLAFDGHLGWGVQLESFREVDGSDADIVSTIRIAEREPLFCNRAQGDAPLRVLVAKDETGRFALGVDPDSFRIRAVVFIGEGERLLAGAGRIVCTWVPLPVDFSADVDAPPTSDATSDLKGFVAQVRGAYISQLVPDIAAAESQVREAEQLLSTYGKEDPNRAFLAEQVAYTKRVVQAARALKEKPTH